ncbi:MAG: hypothetical protein ABUS48_00165 [Pseudomonadota bacterium]
MANAAEQNLIALLADEQRGLRRVLFAGIAVIGVLVIMSGALGVYYYLASEQLAKASQELQQQAFDTRRRVDQQANRAATQERRMRRIYDEMRQSLGAIAGASPDDPALALTAARNVLQHGRHLSLANERLFTQVSGPQGHASPTQKALFTGVLALAESDERGETVSAGANDLPPRLGAARDAFTAANADPALHALAQAGLANVLYQIASSDRQNFRADTCNKVLDAVQQSIENNAPGPQPLWYKAQCERRLGHTAAAFADFARAISGTSDTLADPDDADDAELMVTMNAFNGAGATLTAASGANDQDIQSGLAVARQTCGAGDDASIHDANLRIALACINQAIALRRILRQTDNQVGNTKQSIGFVYLREHNYDAAFKNAVAVERTGLFAQNELVRALAGAHVHPADADDQADARDAVTEATRNIGMFRFSQFNVCELQALLPTDLYTEAQQIFAATHQGENTACTQH